MNLLEQETCPTPDYCIIPLSRGMVTIVDAADYEWLSRYTWYAHRTKKSGYFYAVRKISKRDPVNPGKTVYMHREILGLEMGDPRNGDHREPQNRLDNRRSNLRIATVLQNSMNRGPNKNNTSGFKGVTRSLEWKSEVRWTAMITINGKTKCLGSGIKTREEASELYQKAAREAFGEFAR